MSNEVQTADAVTPRLPFPPQVIGIAGASGSGKTRLASELARELDGIHFPLDNYYFDLSHLPAADRAKENFDDPALIESSLLAAHVAALARGETIERPLYDFSQHIRIPDRTETMQAGAFVLVEGLFALYYPELLSLYQMRVYLDTPDDVCFDRRMRRDTIERGRYAGVGAPAVRSHGPAFQHRLRETIRGPCRPRHRRNRGTGLESGASAVCYAGTRSSSITWITQKTAKSAAILPLWGSKYIQSGRACDLQSCLC